MKKLLLACLIFATSAIHAQQFKVTKTYSANYNPMTGNYDYDNTTYPESMYIVFSKTVIKVTDQANSEYTLGDKVETDNKDCVTYTATDEKNRSCGVSGCNSNGQKSFIVMYPDQYYIIYYVKDND